jgi:hypothetical protein
MVCQLPHQGDVITMGRRGGSSKLDRGSASYCRGKCNRRISMESDLFVCLSNKDDHRNRWPDEAQSWRTAHSLGPSASARPSGSHNPGPYSGLDRLHRAEGDARTRRGVREIVRSGGRRGLPGSTDGGVGRLRPRFARRRRIRLRVQLRFKSAHDGHSSDHASGIESESSNRRPQLRRTGGFLLRSSHEAIPFR